MSVITIDNLVVKFEDIIAVDGIDLKIGEGELFGLLGPNGAGKTTMINVLCGLLKPTNGSVKIGSYDVQNDDKRVKELIGVSPQETALYPHLTGRENIELFGNLYSMSKDMLKRSTDEFLEKMGLTQESSRAAGKYSGGMKRRINLIMGLVHDPKIVFLDEPTAALDPQSRHGVWDLIKELKMKNKTILLTTHYIEEAEELCDRVGVIDYGKLIALGAPKDLMDEFNEVNLEDVFIQLTGRRIRE